MTKTETGEGEKEVRRLTPAYEINKSDYISEANRDFIEAQGIDRDLKRIVEDFDKSDPKKKTFSKNRASLNRKHLYGEFLRQWTRLHELTDHVEGIDRIALRDGNRNVWPKVNEVLEKMKGLIEAHRPNTTRLDQESR